MTEIAHRLPKVIITKLIEYQGNKTSYVWEDDVPEEIQDYAKAVIGDGNARIALSADMGLKDYGNGAGGSVTISLSCNQDVQTMQNVYQFLSQWVLKLARQHTESAYAEYLAMKAQNPNMG